MPKPLRSNFEPGSPREAVRRAQWKALGLSDADMLKPKIAVVNSSSELAICFSHLDGIARVVKDAVREAGGLPFEIRTAAPSDFIISAAKGGGYMLASRDLIVNDMEIAVEGAQLDGMVCLSSCDKTPPAHLMAAGRFNIPTILVICGYQPSGHYQGRHVDIEEVFIGSVQAMFGKLSKETLAGMCDHAITGPGVCAGMGTANSMHIVCEALGMTLPRCRTSACEQSEDVRPRARVGPAHRRDGEGRPHASPNPDAGCISQRRGFGPRGQRLDQLRQTPSGDRRRSGGRRRSLRTLQRAWREGPRAERGRSQRHRHDRCVRGCRRQLVRCSSSSNRCSIWMRSRSPDARCGTTWMGSSSRTPTSFVHSTARSLSTHRSSCFAVRLPPKARS